jgi:hypothetical protein
MTSLARLRMTMTMTMTTTMMTRRRRRMRTAMTDTLTPRPCPGIGMFPRAMRTGEVTANNEPMYFSRCMFCDKAMPPSEKMSAHTFIPVDPDTVRFIDPTRMMSAMDLGYEDEEVARAKLHEISRGDCKCSGVRCSKHLADDELRRHRPHVVVLCGSTRFHDAFTKANYDETMKGSIVLSVAFVPKFRKDPRFTVGVLDPDLRSEVLHGETVGCSPEQKIALDELHKRKIDLADEVYVLNVGGYIGTSTAAEIAYSEMCGKPIRWLVKP